MARSELAKAGTLSVALRAISPPTKQQHNLELHANSMLQFVKLLVRQNAHLKAVSECEKMCQFCEQHSLHVYLVQFLREISIVQLAVRDPIQALPTAIRMLAICDQLYIGVWAALGKVHMANIYLQMKNHQKSKVLVKQALPTICVVSERKRASLDEDENKTLAIENPRKVKCLQTATSTTELTLPHSIRLARSPTSSPLFVRLAQRS